MKVNFFELIFLKWNSSFTKFDPVVARTELVNKLLMFIQFIFYFLFYCHSLHLSNIKILSPSLSLQWQRLCFFVINRIRQIDTVHFISNHFNPSIFLRWLSISSQSLQFFQYLIFFINFAFINLMKKSKFEFFLFGWLYRVPTKIGVYNLRMVDRLRRSTKRRIVVVHSIFQMLDHLYFFHVQIEE